MFKDLDGREIEIFIEDDWTPTVIARHNGKQVGEARFDDWYGVGMLDSAEVEPEYQRSRIGS